MRGIMRFSRQTFSWFTALLLALLYEPAALGQTLTEMPDGLDEIIVTATKREASLENVPIAISAISGERINAAGVADIKGLPKLTPSFMVSGSNSETGGTTLRIRGIGTTGNNIGLEGAVGVFFDGVYLSRPGIALTELIDLDQIEILRGPQGTLFGRNTSAGALNVKTKKPSLTDIEAFSTLSLGSESLVSLQAGVNLPLIKDKLGLRLAGALRERDGYFTSSLGAQSNARDRKLIRAQLLYEPTDKFELRAIADYAEDNSKCCAPVHIRATDIGPLFNLAGLPADGGAPAVGQEAIRSYTTNAGQFSDSSQQAGFSVTARLNMDFGDITYIGAIRNHDSAVIQDADFVNLDVFGSPSDLQNFPSDQDIDLVTHEIDIAGVSFSGRLDWLFGFYHSDENIKSNQSLELGADYQAYAGARLLAIPGIFEAFGSNPLQVLAGGVSADGARANNKFRQNDTSISIYSHNIFKLTDRLNLNLGGRYNHEEKDGRYDQVNVESPACNAVLDRTVSQDIPSELAGAVYGLTCFPFIVEADLPLSSLFPTPRTFNEVYDDNEITYTASLNYFHTPHIMSYVSHSKGFKSGGFNLDPTAAVLMNSSDVARGADPLFSDPGFRAEKTTAYEMGIKSKFNDERGQLNISVFHQDIKDFQVLEFTGVQFETFNVPKVKSTGVEIEGDFLLGEGLRFKPALTWTDARYPENCNSNNQSHANISNLCGEQLTNAPEWVITAGVDYRRDILENKLSVFFGGDIRYESVHRTSTQATQVGSDVRFIDALESEQAKLDLRAGISSRNGWSAEIWGQNVTDQRTQTLTFDIPLNPGARGAIFEPPATYGATLRYTY